MTHRETHATASPLLTATMAFAFAELATRAWPMGVEAATDGEGRRQVARVREQIREDGWLRSIATGRPTSAGWTRTARRGGGPVPAPRVATSFPTGTFSCTSRATVTRSPTNDRQGS